MRYIQDLCIKADVAGNNRLFWALQVFVGRVPLAALGLEDAFNATLAQALLQRRSIQPAVSLSIPQSDFKRMNAQLQYSFGVSTTLDTLIV